MGIINGHKTAITAFLSGVGVVLFGFLISSVFSIGAERQRVIGYIEETKPLDIASTAHRADRDIHVSASDKVILATIPLELRDIHEELRKLNKRLDDLGVRAR
jgi:hypothetical protein